nr:MAG TPA: hypothetical protein [Caudoviricetes sp.]
MLISFSNSDTLINFSSYFCWRNIEISCNIIIIVL